MLTSKCTVPNCVWWPYSWTSWELTTLPGTIAGLKGKEEGREMRRKGKRKGN